MPHFDVIAAVATSVTALGGLFLWSVRHVVRDELRPLVERVDELGGRVTAVEVRCDERDGRDGCPVPAREG